MVLKEEKKENRVFIVVAIFIIVVIIIGFLFSSNNLIEARIEDNILGGSWIQDSDGFYYEERLFGLEKQSSYKYKIKNESVYDRYPANITVTTIKTLFMMNEDDLLSKTIETINQAMQNENIVLDANSKQTGSREIRNGHATKYVLYNGNYTSGNITENIMIVGETWNCGNSGSSIVCIGVAQVTDNKHGNSTENLIYWDRIIGEDIDSLIFNVKCH